MIKSVIIKENTAPVSPFPSHMRNGHLLPAAVVEKEGMESRDECTRSKRDTFSHFSHQVCKSSFYSRIKKSITSSRLLLVLGVLRVLEVVPVHLLQLGDDVLGHVDVVADVVDADLVLLLDQDVHQVLARQPNLGVLLRLVQLAEEEVRALVADLK